MIKENLLMGMINVGKKPIIMRKAVASGYIHLSKKTLNEIKSNRVRKGDPLPVAEIAAIQAAKKTSDIIPHCHQIPLDTVDVDFSMQEDGIEAVCTVQCHARTGVEMEALVGVSIALNTIWDMVKYLEKDDQGQYLNTAITNIRVLLKEKAG
jgi:cyclic pyranopterin phosphate synthase